jgi:type VI secretion system secreted protein Hcp
MATDMFIKLDDIKGESVDDKHKGEIDILSWSWGATQTGSAHVGGGSGTGKANVHDLTFTKVVDKATPLLVHLCLSGKHINKAMLTCRKAGGTPLEHIKFTMNQALVSSVNHGGDKNGDAITETVTLSFASMSMEYVPQKSDGSGDASIVKGWDIAGNKSL